MLPISIAKVADICDGKLGSSENSRLEVCGVASDNRLVKKGDLFIALPGARVDGNQFAGDALARGAVAILSANKEAACAGGASAARIIEVADPLLAIGKIAQYSLAQLRKKNPNLQVVAVTGSVGKTTTKDLLANLLQERGPVVAPPGSFNNELGLPLTVLSADATTATLVLEMGADRAGNIAYLTHIAPPDIGMVLAVARAHLGEFGGIEKVAAAKAEMLSGIRPGGIAILNADDKRVAAMAQNSPVLVYFFSAQGEEKNAAQALYGVKDGSASIFASDIKNNGGRAAFLLHTPSGNAPVNLQLIGIHHINNALAAASAAYQLGISPEKIAQRLSTAFPASRHRMDVQEIGDITIIDDSYNANPDSLTAGILALSDIAGSRRKIAVLGAMLELGEESGMEHKKIGSLLGAEKVAVLYAVGENTDMRLLAESAAQAGVEVKLCADGTEARALLSAESRSGDVILLKGSNGSGIWKIADALSEEGV